MGKKKEKKSKEEGETTRKAAATTTAAEEEEEQKKKIERWRSMPLLRCSYCRFSNIYADVIEHHMTYTHKPNHPTPPNVQLPTMTEKEKDDWNDAFTRKGRKGLPLI